MNSRAFVSKLDLTQTGTQSLTYSTFLGGSNGDEARGIAVDANGNAYVSGVTASLDFPTTPEAFQTARNSSFGDAFFTQFNSTGTGLLYSTYLGGSCDNGDTGNAVALDSNANPYITGSTCSTDFPTQPSNAYQTALTGAQNAYVTKLALAGQVGSFFPVGNLITARQSHTATLLQNGKVLIVGGTDINYQPIASAELYDPLTETFSPTGSLGTARFSHTATLLQNGTVLITGGSTIVSGNGVRLASAELYDPASGTFSYAGTMTNTRVYHTATLLNNGTVLLAGGSAAGTTLSTAELYDPSSGTFTITGAMATARQEHTATLLDDGTVLVAGGVNTLSTNTLTSAEIYSPNTSSFTVTGNMNTASQDHTATLLSSGKVLVAGGYYYCTSCPVPFLARTETYNPVSRTFALTANLSIVRAFDTATLLDNGSVLVVFSTNALEVGIDMGRLDMVVMVGFPDTVMSA